MQPLAIYSLTEKTYSEYSTAYRQTWSALSNDLLLNRVNKIFDNTWCSYKIDRVSSYIESTVTLPFSLFITYEPNERKNREKDAFLHGNKNLVVQFNINITIKIPSPR